MACCTHTREERRRAALLELAPVHAQCVGPVRDEESRCLGRLAGPSFVNVVRLVRRDGRDAGAGAHLGTAGTRHEGERVQLLRRA